MSTIPCSKSLKRPTVHSAVRCSTFLELLFDGRPLRDLLIEAIRYGERPGQNSKEILTMPQVLILETSRYGPDLFPGKVQETEKSL
jgi:hypothetical protein